MSNFNWSNVKQALFTYARLSYLVPIVIISGIVLLGESYRGNSSCQYSDSPQDLRSQSWEVKSVERLGPDSYFALGTLTNELRQSIAVTIDMTEASGGTLLPGQVFRFVDSPSLAKLSGSEIYNSDNSICARAFVKRVQLQLVSESGQLSGVFLAQRYRLTDLLDKKLSPLTAGLVKGLIFGETVGISKSELALFKDLGLSHLIAISGGNFTLVLGLVDIVMRQLLPKLWRQIGIVAAAFIYIQLVGTDNLPALRAFVFVTLAITLNALGRRVTKPKMFLWGVCIVLILSPLGYKSISLQLSLASWTLINLFSQGIVQKLSGIPPYLRDEVVTSLLGSILVAPVSLFYFGKLNLISPLINTIVAPIFVILTFASLATTVTVQFELAAISWCHRVLEGAITGLFGFLQGASRYSWVVLNSENIGRVLLLTAGSYYLVNLIKLVVKHGSAQGYEKYYF